MNTDPVFYYIGTFLGAVLGIAIIALPIVLLVILIRNYLVLRREVFAYRDMVDAEEMEAARQRAIALAEGQEIDRQKEEAIQSDTDDIYEEDPDCDEDEDEDEEEEIND